MNCCIRKIVVWSFALCFAAAAQAQQNHNISKGFVILNERVSSNVFYDTDFGTGNPDFTNEVAHIMENGSLLLGGEVQSSRGIVDSQETAADKGELFYSVNGGSFSVMNLPKISTGAPDVWQQGTFTGMVEVGKSLPLGVHTLSVYFVATDLNFPLGGPIPKRLPETGTYDATIRVSPAAPDLIACDTAADQAYGDGWNHGDNGGFGFGPWVHLTNFLGDGDAAGFFTAKNPPNTDVNHILSNGKAWGTYANESGTGGDDIQIAMAYRPLNQPLQVGQTLSIDIEHSGIQAGSLSANTPPRTGGWVGFALRALAPSLQGDPDPFNAFGTLQNASFALGFRGGNSHYHAYDIVNPTSGFSVGIPYTTNGIQVRFTLTTTSSYYAVITSKGNGSFSTNISGILSSGDINGIALYNRNAEEGDAHFNNLYIFDAPVTNKQAYDDAADAAYNGGWTNTMDGGFGFEPWSIFAVEDGGAAGSFTALNLVNSDLNFIDTTGEAWGMYANDNGVGGQQFVTAQRSFTDGQLGLDQSFSIDMEHGGISGINGEVKIVLIGTGTFGNPMGEVLTYKFTGGGSNYTYFDDTPGTQDTGIPWSPDGFRLTYTQTSDSEPYTFAMKIETFGVIAGVHYFNGYVDTIPKTVKVVIRDVEDADVFINSLCIAGIPTIQDIIISSLRLNGTIAEIGFQPQEGVQYVLRQRPDLLLAEWSEVSSDPVIGIGGIMILTNNTMGMLQFYQVGTSTNAP